jgi:hypothetical protein
MNDATNTNDTVTLRDLVAFVRSSTLLTYTVLALVLLLVATVAAIV